MKAQRRHELKTNTLAQQLEKAPAFFQKYGSRILLGIILCLLAFILMRNHLNEVERKKHNASESLGSASLALNDMNSIVQSARPNEWPTFVKGKLKDIEELVQNVLENSDDPNVQASAWLIRGNANVRAAQFPPIPGASTRPEIGLDKKSDDYLTAAANAYNKVLEAPLNQNHEAVVSARIGLGDVAEDQGKFDKAREMYQLVADDPSSAAGFKDIARAKLDGLKELEKPVYFGTPEERPRVRPGIRIPTTVPSINAPTTAPSISVPTTQPTGSGPTTRP